MSQASRRGFLQTGARAAALLWLAPTALSCARGPGRGASGAAPGIAGVSPLALPQTRPADWDPIRFNRDRGNRGAIPETYLGAVNGPDGAENHIGKHLPYLVDLGPGAVPDGFAAVMWGNPSRGRAQHPNAAPNPDSGFVGHWFDWVAVRKATADEAPTAWTRFDGWPASPSGDGGRFAVEGGGDIAENGGKNTVYLVRLPDGVAPGDTLRIHGHCLNHGEYVDFVDWE